MPKNTRSPAGHTNPPLWAGQNFLTSGPVIRQLLDVTTINRTDSVLEIGSGKGHITRELLPRCKNLLAAELDPALCQKLTERFGRSEGFQMHQGDFLRMPLPAGPYKVFANIPFGRTTEIIRRLTEGKNPPSAAWLIVESGAAKRFAGKPADTLTSLRLRPFFQLRIAAFIPKKEFHPAPRVDAALLELIRRPQPDLPMEDRTAYCAFLEQGWKQGLTNMLTKKQISTALRLEGLPPAEESATMKYVQWLCLFRCWQRMGKNKPGSHLPLPKSRKPGLCRAKAGRRPTKKRG